MLLSALVHVKIRRRAIRRAPTTHRAGEQYVHDVWRTVCDFCRIPACERIDPVIRPTNGSRSARCARL
jgi:hypothetical protein